MLTDRIVQQTHEGKPTDSGDQRPQRWRLARSVAAAAGGAAGQRAGSANESLGPKRRWHTRGRGA